MTNPRLPEFDESSPLRPSRFGHIVLKTAQYEAMANWYKTVLNAEPLFEKPPVLTFLTFDDEHHRLLVALDPNVTPKDPNSAGVAHWAYLFNDLSELMTTYARLRDQGITPTYCVNHGFQFSLYYHDPDNNEVELGCDNFQTRQEINDWFELGHFANNFYGYNFDPEEVYKKHVEGVPDAQIYEDTYPVDQPPDGPAREVKS
jgi:catechol 2,3-dioxygenase-like lactoylglutathione lyase family enzyme